MRLYPEDTICAITTPLGTSSIGGIRVSGKDSLSIVKKLFQPFTEHVHIKSHTLYYGTLFFHGKSIDDCTAVYMQDPHSYTKENSVELFLHGNPLILQEALGALIKSGSRFAEPGEFTKRAFLNGRFDLVQAESVAEIINARSTAYLDVVRENEKGMLSSYIETVIQQILNTLALIEANIEFPEDEIDQVYKDKSTKDIVSIIHGLEKLIQNFESTRLLKEGVIVALIGKVNVGKSTLMNTLLQKNRSIITNIPGTTRDVIADSITIHGINFMLHDTAGLRVADNEVEQIGLQKTQECIDSSDIILFIVDATAHFDEEHNSLFNQIKQKKNYIGVLNKIDTMPTKEYFDFIPISAKEQTGIEQLKSKLSEVAEKLIPRDTYKLVINLRQKMLIEEAKRSMLNVESLLQMNKELELVSFELKEALTKLEEIIGKKYSEDLLTTIFSKFCVGK